MSERKKPESKAGEKARMKRLICARRARSTAERGEVRRILSLWPELDEADESVVIAINNSFNNLLGYPARNGDEGWPKFISVTHGEVARIFDKWKGKSSRGSDEQRNYFDNLM